MKLVKYLANLGYGSRREVMRMCLEARVRRRDHTVMSPDATFAHDDILVYGEPLDPPPGAVVMLHKPVGYVCSTKDASPLIYALLPDRFARRSPIMAPIGRLDRDSSGLLLITDDGQLNHRITSPRRHLRKVYEAQLAFPLRGDEAQAFGSGTLMLDGESTPLRPATLEVTAPQSASLILTEGRYHQVRRMFAAVGNHVASLHRSRIGSLRLGDLPVGAWRLITDAERQQLQLDIELSLGIAD